MKPLATIEGYFQFYEMKAQELKIYKLAYQATEDELFKQYGFNRYSSYVSFRICKKRYYDQKLKK